MTGLEPLRARLHALPVGAPEGLRVPDPHDAPPRPADLFLEWLEDAVDAGIAAPHAMTLATADRSGAVTARAVILTDLDDDGWHFATDAASPKALALTHDPRAALTFLWPAVGRQVRLTGRAVRLPPERGAADFLARSEGSRAAALVGHQSEPLDTLAAYRAAVVDARTRVHEQPDLVPDGWSEYALAPHEVEFWQVTPDRLQVRLRYRCVDGTWVKGLLWP